jgi:protoheme IX farnesyltransferase
MAAMDYVRAAQPRIVALFLVTVLAAALLCGSPAAWRLLVVLAATAFTVGGAALLNNVIERDVDRRMERTRRRPTASGRIPPARATLAGIAAVAAGAAALWAVAGGLAALFALLGAAYYVLVYTVLLKPHTALSAVPGGVAGVFPALIGWAATGAPWSGEILFLCVLVPVWSPPHSWALTLALGEDYRASGIPTPPTRYGDAATRRLIAAFVAGLTVVLAAPLGIGLFGAVYAAGMSLAAVLLWAFTARLSLRPSTAAAWALFKVTGPCLALVLAAAVADRLT